MAAVTKSWIETTCDKCACRRVFHVSEGWLLVCSVCATQMKLEKSGLVKV